MLPISTISRLSIISSRKFLFVFLISFIFPYTSSAWFDCYWPYRSQVTIVEQSGTALSDYQLELVLDASSLHSNYNWSAAGDDIRLVDIDDSTVLDFYIDEWNSVSKTAIIYVKIDLAANQTKNIYIYYGNEDAASISDASLTFTEPGIKFHTRNSTSNPANKSAAFSAFNSASDGVAGYGCKIVTDFTNISNHSEFSPPSVTTNFGGYSETFFEVAPSDAGNWSFRYGADFGYGGGLYVDDVALDEKWNDDLWWAYNWANTAETLQGTINLSAGYHKLEVIGFEGCCDGGITVQFQKPGDTFKSYSEANIGVKSRKCPVTAPIIQYTNPLLEKPSISITKTSTVLSDPIQGTSNPKRIPGSIVRYVIAVSNAGNAADANTIKIDDPVPANVSAMVAAGNIGFTDGAISSGLSFNYVPLSTTDSVAFSDNGTSYTYAPVADVNDADSSISHLRFKPTGRFGCTNSASSTSFSIFYDVLIE